MLLSLVVIFLLAGQVVECVPGKKSKSVRKGVKGVEKGTAAPTPSDVFQEPTPVSTISEPTIITPPAAARASKIVDTTSIDNGIRCARCHARDSDTVRKAFPFCPKCKTTAYCSQKCQVAHHKEHKV